MKAKVTAKSVRDMFPDCVSAGYADLQFLLNGKVPIAYTSGKYGWNFDVYQVHGVTICTGYRNMPGRRANNIEEYNGRAEKILHNWDIDWEEKDRQLDELLAEFCAQA